MDPEICDGSGLNVRYREQRQLRDLLKGPFSSKEKKKNKNVRHSDLLGFSVTLGSALAFSFSTWRLSASHTTQRWSLGYPLVFLPQRTPLPRRWKVNLASQDHGPGKFHNCAHLKLCSHSPCKSPELQTLHSSPAKESQVHGDKWE